MSWGDEPAPEGAGADGLEWGQDPPRNQLRPLNLGDVLDGTFRLLREHWRAFAIGLGAVVVPMVLLSGLMNALLLGSQPGLMDMMQDQQVMQEWLIQGPPTSLGTMIAVSALAVLVGLLLTPLQYGTSAHIAATGYRNGTADAMTSLRAAGQRYWSLLGATVLIWLVPLVIYLIPVVLLVAAAATDAGGLAILGGLGMIASFVFAVIAIVRIALAVPTLMLERVGAVEALRRSNALVKGKTGVMFGTLLVVAILTWIIAFVVAWPFGLIGGVLGGGAGAIAAAVGDMVSSLVLTGLFGAALVLLYFDRRVRKEGYDLTELANQLGEPQDPSW